MANNLSTELEKCGCNIGVDRFHDLIRVTFHDLFGDMSDEELLCNPRKAIKFCKEVRDRMGSPNIPDPIILKDVLNLRKRCRLKIDGNELLSISRNGEKHPSENVKTNDVPLISTGWKQQIDERLDFIESMIADLHTLVVVKRMKAQG